jgi:hypothetical protein
MQISAKKVSSNGLQDCLGYSGFTSNFVCRNNLCLPSQDNYAKVITGQLCQGNHGAILPRYFRGWCQLSSGIKKCSVLQLTNRNIIGLVLLFFKDYSRSPEPMLRFVIFLQKWWKQLAFFSPKNWPTPPHIIMVSIYEMRVYDTYIHMYIKPARFGEV